MTIITFTTVAESRSTTNTLIMCYVTCLLLYRLLWLLDVLELEGPRWLCHLFILCSRYFAWSGSLHMNTLCYDLSRAFGTFRTRHGSNIKDRRIKYYMGYAWGIPMLMTLVMVFMMYHPQSPHEITEFRWNNRYICYVSGDYSEWVYTDGPQVLLTSVNSVLEILTIVRICKDMRATAAATRQTPATRGMTIFFYLACLIGPSKVMVVILSHVLTVRENSLIVRSIEAVADLLREVAIFMYVCCRRSVLTAAKRCLRCTYGRRHN